MEFWDDLDFIGIQAYFPLSEREDPTLDELIDGWRDAVERLEQLHADTGIPVIFTEIGYRATVDAAIEPWLWRSDADGGDIDAGPQTQARCYQAFFQTVWQRDWFAGAYFWKWFPNHAGSGGPGHRGFTPQNKPAQRVLTDWYGRFSGS